MKLFDDHDIKVFIDGGWGVDALLHRQSRRLLDLDIAMEHRDVLKLRELLEARGYRDIPKDDTWECNFVLGDDLGHELDIQSNTFNAEGIVTFGVPYPSDSLTGTGTIGCRPVHCISPEWMVEFHRGYELDMDDYRDVSVLCERFGIEVPPEYEKFQIVGAGESEE